MIVVKLYSKEDCHLCDEARTVLERVRKDLPFKLTEVKLSSDHPQYDKFHESIPVVYVAEKLAFRYQVNVDKLRNLLTEEAKERTEYR